MTQATILAAGVDNSTSTDVVVAAGAVATIGIFAATGSVVPGMRAVVFVDTPGADNRLIDLDHITKETQVAGPATYRATRVNASSAFGIWSET